jgi:ureidoglycolate hydrolase
VPDLKRLVSSRPLTADCWAPFGWLPVRDTDPADGSHRLSFEWADPHVNLIAHFAEEVPATADGFRCEMMFRHRSHTQVLMPLDHRCVIAVAPSDLCFEDVGAADAVRAFRLEPLQTVVLHRGTWHWGPFPTDSREVQLFNVQGLGYRDDNENVELGALGLVISTEPT